MGLVALANVGFSAVLVNVNFETDPSASFTVRNGAGDFGANFSYDYSTFAPSSFTTPASIPAAPSGAGTKALRLEANNNDATAAQDAVTVFPNAAAGLSNYVIKFDLWMSNTGDATGAGTGSTEYFTCGGHSDAAQAAWTGATASKGFFWAFDTDGDEAAAYHYYEANGAAPLANNATPNWFGSNQTSTAGAGWQALFPAPTYRNAGTASKAWNVVEMQVVNGSVTVFVTPTGGTRTQVGAWTVANGLTSGSPFFGQWDPFASVASPASDAFSLIDNLTVTSPIPVVAGAEDWSLFQ